jgi:lysophospholipase L1-like esterase
MHKRSNYKVFVFGAVATILVLAVLELGSYVLLRFFTQSGTVRPNQEMFSPFHAYLGWEHPKNVAISTTTACDAQDRWITTDQYGRSITPLSFNPPRVQVAVLGGSTMFGVGSSDNRFTVPSLLEQLIHEQLNIPVEVFNLGVRGYTSFQEMLALHTFLVDNEVDLVLVIGGRNDALAAAFSQASQFALKPRRLQTVEELVRRIERGDVVISGLPHALRSNSFAAELVYRLFDKLRRDRLEASGVDPAMEIPTFDNIDERAGLTMKHYALMDSIARLNGAEFVAFLQPTAFTKKSLTEDEIACIEGPDVASYVRTMREHAKEYQNRFYEYFRAVDKPFTFVDLSDALDQMQSRAYMDSTHYSDAGARALAQAVLENIEPNVRRAWARSVIDGP